MPNDTGEAHSATEEPTPEPISPQEPGSDTVVAESGAGEALDSTQMLSPEEVHRLQRELDQLMKIRQGQDRANTQLQKERDDLQKKIEELTGQLKAYQTATDGNEEAIAAFEAEIARQKQEAAEWRQKAEEAIAEAERLKIVAGEFPQMAPLVMAGALPQAGDVDEFRGKMEQLATAWSSAAEAAIQARGQHPAASPGRSQTPDLETIKRQILAASAAGDMQRYQELQAQWHEVVSQVNLPAGRPDF